MNQLYLFIKSYINIDINTFYGSLVEVGLFILGGLLRCIRIYMNERAGWGIKVKIKYIHQKQLLFFIFALFINFIMPMVAFVIASILCVTIYKQSAYFQTISIFVENIVMVLTLVVIIMYCAFLHFFIFEKYYCNDVNKKIKEIVTVSLILIGLIYFLFNNMWAAVSNIVFALFFLNEILGLVVFGGEEIKIYDHAYLNIYINGSKPVFEVSILDLRKKKNWFIIKRKDRDIRVNESNVIKIEYYGEEKKALAGYDYLHFKKILEEL